MLQFFAPLVKVDEAQRLVYGTAALEQVDKADEIFDYGTSKPYFLAWSESLSKSSNGRNLGNVRAMHGSVAAGHLIEVTYDDENKKIDVVAKITDDNEWNKVVAGTYTGFSIGGKYLRKWSDPSNPMRKRYTARPSEVTLADNPCMPGATFTMMKSDGAVAQVEARGLEGGASPASDPRDQVYQVWCCKTIGHEHFEKADSLECVQKVNENHDDKGRFASGDGAGSKNTEKMSYLDRLEEKHLASNYMSNAAGALELAGLTSPEVGLFVDEVTGARPADLERTHQGYVERAHTALREALQRSPHPEIHEKIREARGALKEKNFSRAAMIARDTARYMVDAHLPIPIPTNNKIETGDGLAKTEENEMNEQEKNELSKTVSGELSKTFATGLEDLRKTILEPLAKTVADNKKTSDEALAEIKKVSDETSEAVQTLADALAKVLAAPADEPNAPVLKVVRDSDTGEHEAPPVRKTDRIDDIKASLAKPFAFAR